MTDILARPVIQTRPLVRPRLGWRMAGLLALLGLTCGLFLLNVATGSVTIPLDSILAVLSGGVAETRSWDFIIRQMRLPGAVTAGLAGAALGVSGLQMQTLFRNPLADPFILGISSGASLGVALVVLGAGGGAAAWLVAGLSLSNSYHLIGAASLGAGAVLMLVLLIAERVRSVVTLLILGLMIGYLTGALVSILLYTAAAERVQAYTVWTFGSFGGVTWSQIELFTPAIFIGLGLALGLSKSLNALLLGEAYARSMGLAVRRARLLIILSTAILAGTVTAFCGPIAFLGVAVPHIGRALFQTSDHRLLMPVTMLLGASLALLADLVAQTPGDSSVLPLNAVTALIGAPIVTWVILRQRHLRESFAG